jgi:hypothetical protein
MISCEMQDAFDQIIHLLGLFGALFAAIGGIYFGFDSVERKLSTRIIYAVVWAPVVLTVPIAWLLTLFLDPAVAHDPGYEWTLGVLFGITIVLALARFYVFDVTAVPEGSSRSRAWGWGLLVFGFALLLFQQVVDTTFMFEKHHSHVAKCES